MHRLLPLWTRLARRFSILPAAFAIAFTSAATPPAHAASAPPVNQLANPGFEAGREGSDWMPAGWDTSRAGLSSVFFGRDTLLAHAGQYSVTVANVSALWPFSHNWSQALVVKPSDWNKDAVFSIWTRTSGLDGRAYILLQAYRDTISMVAAERHVLRDSIAALMNIKPGDDPLYDLGWKRSAFNEAETGWVRREVRLYVPPLTNVIFVRAGLTGTGQLMIDDASLTYETARPAPAVPLHTNLLTDSSFEDNGLTWEFSLPPYRNMIGRIDSTVAHTGRKSVMFTGGEGGWISAHAGVCFPLSNRNLRGKHIKLTGWFKVDSLRSNTYNKFYFHTLHGIEQVTTKDQFSGTKPWSEATLEADVPDDTYEVWAWWVFNAPAPGIVHIDDCTLEVTGPATSSRKPKR
jgi:hypothetical protein